jgi:hypothetical protein
MGLLYLYLTFIVGKSIEKCVVQKVPRHCPLGVLLKRVWRQGGALLSGEKWTVFGMEQRREAVTVLGPSFCINIQAGAKLGT